jgi:hypothetical protein
MKKLFYILSAALIGCAAPVEQSANIEVLGHRGGRYEVDENTLSAFVTSYENGVLSYETDIRLTADNELIISHDASLKRTTFDVKLDFYPFPNSSSFFLSAGASFGGEKLATLSGHSDEAEKYINQLSDMGKYEGNYYINIDDETRIPIDRNGNATGRVEVSKVRPYVGLGFGRHTPGKRIGMRIELGAQFHGTPNIIADNAIGNINSAIKGEVDNDLVEIIDKMVVYPVLKLTLCGRIF